MTSFRTGALTGLRLAVCTSVKSGGVVNIKIGSVIYAAQAPQDLSVAVKDPVIVGKVGNQYYIIQRFFTAVGNVEVGTIDEPPSGPCSINGTTTFLPRRTATYRAGKWRTDTDDLYQGQTGSQGNQTGCAFYGTQLKTLAGATVLSAFLKAERLAAGKTHTAQATTLRHVTENAKPSGAPTVGGSYDGPDLSVGSTRTRIVLDTTLVTAMIAGTYGGLAIFDSGGSPYVRLAGKSHYAASFAITIAWQRDT